MSHVLVVELYVEGVTEITHVVIISSMLSTHVKYEHVFMMSDVLLMRKNDTQTLVMQMLMPFGSLRLKRYMFFTRGQFWPPGIVVACVCVCVSVCLSVCLCVNHLLVRAITRDLFKLGPNLDQRCKRPWLKSLLFWGQLTLTFKVK